MEKIASFAIDHDKLKKGMYISRIDGDIVSYDIRMKEPNKGDYLPYGAIHAFEHTFATFARNTPFADQVVYVGPMGCRTGFYFLVRDSMSHADALQLVKDNLDFVLDFDGPVPGSSQKECGNYREHDLAGAKEMARDMKAVLADWRVEDMSYDV